MVRRMIQTRRATVQITDKRVRLLQEILQGIRLLVLFVCDFRVGGGGMS